MTIFKRLKNIWKIGEYRIEEEQIFGKAAKKIVKDVKAPEPVAPPEKKMAKIVMPKVEKDEDVKFEINERSPVE